MVSNNKILTVSYGTFSCTLEGFDDSFDTMKAIAEYFRDLASDDRYFGAEPPQPDAEMLTRIAQREISRQVEARTSATGIVLRATDMPDTSKADAPAREGTEVVKAEPAATVAVDDVDSVDGQAVVDKAEPEITGAEAPLAETKPQEDGKTELAAQAPSETEPSEPETAPETTPETVAAEDTQPKGDAEPAEAELTETEATRPEPTEPEPVSAEDGQAQLVGAGDSAKVSIADELVSQASRDEMPVKDSSIGAAIAAAVGDVTDIDGSDAAEMPLDESPGMTIPQDVPELAEDTPAEIVPAADSIAAKLQRIRAVVAQNELNEQSVISADYSEDQHADPLVASVAQQITGALDEDDEAQVDELEDIAEDEISLALKRLDDTGEISQQPAENHDTALFDDLDSTDMDQDEDLDLEDLDLSVLDNVLSGISKTDDASADDSADEVDKDIAQDAEPPQARGRVIKVKRADLEAAISTGDLEEIEDDDDTGQDDTGQDDTGQDDTGEREQPQMVQDSPKAYEESSLSVEDEADLMRELAEVEADLSLDEVETGIKADPDQVETEQTTEQALDEVDSLATTMPDADTETDTDSDSDEITIDLDGQTDAPVLAETVGDDEENVSRLMDAADEKLDDPDASSSRETYDHMRAAIAAAEADRSAGGDIGGDNDDNAYREDLASVVRPRRPSIREKRPSRPATIAARPAPLKLVAEQRVDEGAAEAHRGPVRPRRVVTVPIEETGHDAAAGAEGGFARFAERMGAVDLPDTLEAAAAYLSFVEGREQFSRPQLMNKVRQIKEQDFNREDGLRSFGQLLRDGKIQKTGGGRFTASGEIGFRPDPNTDARQAG